MIFVTIPILAVVAIILIVRFVPRAKTPDDFGRTGSIVLTVLFTGFLLVVIGISHGMAHNNGPDETSTVEKTLNPISGNVYALGSRDEITFLIGDTLTTAPRDEVEIQISGTPGVSETRQWLNPGLFYPWHDYTYPVLYTLRIPEGSITEFYGTGSNE